MTNNHRPTIKDDHQYEAMSLRDDGMSKDQAARIADMPRAKDARKVSQLSPSGEWTKNNLYERDQEIDISDRSQTTKEELIDALHHF